ncbi:hypothetical protein [Enterobacillus tribolii]|uniref:Uncharacterized protein n=1 Tax=Enterobacillus tribolii TaxID=1487935 RepID=A0A370QPY6_9GAMM|nr:hypothetical protein [Enterobacillus tribolii]MBW7981390.1 hypothetical protein [Enterobacillus tribolii]RDK90765.1 hypothetical protein C8D90_10539 [Enterobacillus tribolii]
MLSISEHYEKSTLSLAIGKRSFINTCYFGQFIGITGHDLDHANLSFIFELDNKKRVSIPAYCSRLNFEYHYPDGQKSYLNPLLHCIMIIP